VSSDSTPPDRVFFIDYCLGGVAVPDALRAEGVRVEVHLDSFAPDLSDELLLAAIGQRGWVFLSKDGNIRKRLLERKALMESGVRAFILTSGNLRSDEQAMAFRLALPAIQKLCNENEGPFIARVTRLGNVEVIEGER
jgi:PIN like domain